MLRIQSVENWAASKVDGFPARWRSRLLSSYRGKIAAADALPGGKGLRNVAMFDAGRELCEVTERLAKVRLPLDASDGDICARAEEFAILAMDVGRIQVSSIEAAREGMEGFVKLCGLVPPSSEINKKTGEKRVSDRGAVGRMTCRDWWRRGLRKMHAKAVEGAAIKLGYVNRARDLYVSNESLARRQQQIKRNQSMMENTTLENEEGQAFTLAELAATGTANKAIRRGELMTRIAGFEKIAVDCGHGGLFLTLTCPSRMHKWVDVSGPKWKDEGGARVYENPKYDGTTPRAAQAYLSKVYARIRSKLARDGVGVYGFRIAEPHHDGCPHWHVLLFHSPGLAENIADVFRRYALADSPDENGAKNHRVKVEVIDWKRGSAAGYIAKYVAKNIDGLHVENDLYGNPAMETSLRVEAWASTWGIRQFQQVGGAPVGVWRELRRVRELPDGAPDHLRAAHAAVNKVEGEDGNAKQADWAGYVIAQGGVFIGRAGRIQIAREESGVLGRYGEEVSPRPIGVSSVGGEFYRDGIVPDRFRLVEWLVRSVRHVWQVVKRRVSAAVSSPPWTCVNNCTREGLENAGKNGSGVVEKAECRVREVTGVREGPSGGGFFAADWFVAGAFG